MDIHWAQFPKLRDPVRHRIESRLKRLARSHRDLLDIHLVAHPADHHEQGMIGVKITCLAAGHPITTEREHEDVGRALHEALDAFEREVLEMRDRERTLRTQHRAEPLEEALHARGEANGSPTGSRAIAPLEE